MPSYQDIETRLRVVEDKLHFLMNALGHQTAEPTGMIDPATNQPVIRVTKKTFLDVYREYNNANLQAMAAKADWDRRGVGDVGPTLEQDRAIDTGGQGYDSSGPVQPPK